MSYRNENFGHELWHSFFTAALTGLTGAAYDKKDFVENIDDTEEARIKVIDDNEEVRGKIIDEAIAIANASMDEIIGMSAYDLNYKNANSLLFDEIEKRWREHNEKKFGPRAEGWFKAREKELEATRIFNEEINDEHRREADLTEEFSEAELQEMKV